VTISATDIGSFVEHMQYSLDGGLTWNNYAGQFSLATEGVNTLLYRSIDHSGNVEVAREQVISIDTGSPLVTGSIVAGADHEGWYGDDVLVRFTVIDSISGAFLSTHDEWVEGEGSDLSISWTGHDNAGNHAICTVSGIKIDRQAPMTTLAFTGPIEAGDPMIIYTITSLSLASYDDLSGVKRIEYDVDGAGWTSYAGQFFVLPGIHSLSYRAIDVVGNLEDVNSIIVDVQYLSLPTLLTYTGETSGIYSDTITLSARLTLVTTGEGFAGRIVSFNVGSSTISATTDVTGLASVQTKLDLNAGAYPVTAGYSGEIGYDPAIVQSTLTVVKERSSITYSGATIVDVIAPATTGTLALRATVLEDNDDSYGDMSSITMFFTCSGQPLASAQLTSVEPGVWIAEASISLVTDRTYTIIVTMDTNPYYDNTATSLPVVVTVATVSTSDFVTGSGTIWDSSGVYGSFGFVVRFDKYNKPSGSFSYIWEKDGLSYIMTATSITGLIIERVPSTHAFFEGKGMMQTYDAATGVTTTLPGTYSFRADVWDNSALNLQDGFEVKILNPYGVIYHLAGYGAAPLDGALTSGNIVIHRKK
jgi:hypothetical protein